MPRLLFVVSDELDFQWKSPDSNPLDHSFHILLIFYVAVPDECKILTVASFLSSDIYISCLSNFFKRGFNLLRVGAFGEACHKEWGLLDATIFLSRRKSPSSSNLRPTALIALTFHLPMFTIAVEMNQGNLHLTPSPSHQPTDTTTIAATHQRHHCCSSPPVPPPSQ
ncbi:hypothetical protein L1887_36762 [Cichorium endivia]|nr:hypothetical protein L1887_36762 [Cichorium endivia]